jgi:phospholipid transport system substrate-binding protein
MRLLHPLGAAVLILLIAAAVIRPASAQDVSTAKQLVNAIVDDGLTTFRGKQMTPQERGRLLAEKIRKYSDPKKTSAQLLGRYWTRANDDLQARFSSLLVDYIVDTWSGQLADISPSQKIFVTGAESAADGVLVHATSTSDEDAPSIVDWLISPAADGRNIVADVSVDGVSLIKTMSADFTAVLRSNGGNLDGLMDAIKKKIASHAK